MQLDKTILCKLFSKNNFIGILLIYLKIEIKVKYYKHKKLSSQSISILFVFTKFMEY